MSKCMSRCVSGCVSDPFAGVLVMAVGYSLGETTAVPVIGCMWLFTGWLQVMLFFIWLATPW